MTPRTQALGRARKWRIDLGEPEPGALAKCSTLHRQVIDRFQCSGCGFYRADPSYIPAIEDHIQAPRADRELANAMDVDDFVIRNLTDQIDCPAEDVFAYATDPTRFKEWQKGVVDGHMDQSGTPRVGAQCSTTRRIGGANRRSTSRLEYINPPTTWGVKGIDGPIRATVDLTVEALTDTRSRLTIAVDFEGHGIGKVLVPLVVRREAQKEMPGNLATLKQHLELPDA